MTSSNRINPLIETHQLTKQYDSRGAKLIAVDKFSLSIAPNEVVGLVGESGSGKSTLGKMIVGLETPTDGSILYRGKTLPTRHGKRDFKQSAKKMQMIFQDPYSSLNPRMTVEEIVSEGLRLTESETSSLEIRQRVVEGLKLVGLNEECLSRYPHEFSGGQRQRVGIARVLALRPEFIVCDEPISALDVSVQAQVINLLKDLKSQLGLTLLFIAHDLSMVRYISDRVLVMYRGHLVESGPTEAIFTSPKHPYTQALLSANPAADPKTAREMESPVLHGEITENSGQGRGCIFAARCPQVHDACFSYSPNVADSKSPAEDSHIAACIKCEH